MTTVEERALRFIGEDDDFALADSLPESATVDECADDSDPIKIDLPDVRQDENYTCGAACCQSLCQHYGVGPDREADYAKALGSDPDAGTDYRRIVAYLRERGLNAEPKQGMSVDDLKASLDRHTPVILAFQAWGDQADYSRDDNGHYAIAIGYDAEHLYLEDPSLEGSRGAIPWAEFEQRWHDEEADGTKLVRFGIVVSQVKPRPIEAVESVSPDKVALGGRDGETVEKLIERTIRTGSRAVAELIETAVTRILQRGQVIATSRLFDDNERQELAAVIAATRATANLLGRALVRDWLERSTTQEARIPLATLLEEIGVPAKPVQPRKALSYFQRLVPKLGTDPERFAPTMEREAFTMAVATEEQMLRRVMDTINERLATGAGISSAPQDIKAIMDQAGVSSRNPQYSEMTFRTNAMDAYNTGLQQEVNAPEVVENFPVWEYHAIVDSRSRPEHAARNGLYYPNSAKFAQVRGGTIADAANCRCSFSPVYIEDWKELRKGGARVADGYPEPVV